MEYARGVDGWVEGGELIFYFLLDLFPFWSCRTLFRSILFGIYSYRRPDTYKALPNLSNQPAKNINKHKSSFPISFCSFICFYFPSFSLHFSIGVFLVGFFFLLNQESRATFVGDTFEGVKKYPPATADPRHSSADPCRRGAIIQRKLAHRFSCPLECLVFFF